MTYLEVKFILPLEVVSECEQGDLAQNHPDVFTLSVLMRAQACKQDQNVDLSYSLFASALSEDRMLPLAGELVDCLSEEPKEVPESAATTAVSLPLTREALISSLSAVLNKVFCRHC